MKKIELKTKAWAKEYIANNFNGTETALKFGKKGMTRRTAEAIASENLSKAIYQKPIIREMDNIKLDDTLINRITKRNIKQKGSLSASNTAIDIYHKVKGTYAPIKRETVNVNLKGADLDKRIDEKIEELKQLQDEV